MLALTIAEAQSQLKTKTMMMTRRHRLFTVFSLCLMFFIGASVSHGKAALEIVAKVNGKAITNYDVDQRAAFLLMVTNLDDTKANRQQIRQDATQSLIDDLAKSFNMTVFSRFQAINGPALQRLVNEHNVQIKTFPDEVLVALGNAAGEVVFERGSINAETKSLSNHLLSFRKVIKEWFTKGEQEFSRIRDLPFKFPDSV